jgi:hypothetical protein
MAQLIFVCLTNVLLITSLISLLSNSLAKVSECCCALLAALFGANDSMAEAGETKAKIPAGARART